MALSHLLVEFARDCASRGNHAYLLIDGAHSEGANLHLERHGIPYESLFSGYPEAALPEIAPLLIPMQGLAEPELMSLAAWAMDLGLQYPCLSWIEAPHSSMALASHLRLFHTVGLSDSQRMLMRWYDTRILPIWLAALNTEQFDLFTAPFISLNYLNRFGEVAHLPVRGGGHELVPPRNVIRDETNQLTNCQLTEFVAKYQQRAVAAGLDDINRQIQYLLLALYTSGEGLEHPACKELMKSPPERFEDFFERIQQLPDAVWETGRPLWETRVESNSL